MDLKQFTTESEPLILADLDPEFKALEGEVEVAERVTVVVRQATMQDNMKRADLNKKRERRLIADDMGQVGAIGQVYESNPLRRAMYETYWTLNSVSNLTVDGKPVFSKMPVNQMSWPEFDVAWGSLNPIVARAIHAAVLKVNPDWADLGE